MRLTNNLETLFFIIVFVGGLFFNSSPSYGFEDDQLILSNGSSLIACYIKDNKLSEPTDILNGTEWSYVSWPSYSEMDKIIFFEAQNNDYGFSRMIFSLKRSLNSEKPIKTIEGRRPAISFDGSLLCFYRHPNQLWMLDTTTKESRLLVSNFSDYQPAVWVSEKHLLYSDIENQLIKLDVVVGEAQSTGHEFLIPGALSPDRTKVLCGSYDGKSISIYLINTNEIVKVRESSTFSMGSSFVWSQDAKQFLYTRQTFFDLIKLSEVRSLFRYSPKGKEIKLIDKFALFGGITAN